MTVPRVKVEVEALFVFGLLCLDSTVAGLRLVKRVSSHPTSVRYLVFSFWSHFGPQNPASIQQEQRSGTARVS